MTDLVRFESLVNTIADQESVPHEMAQALVDTENMPRDPNVYQVEGWGGGSYGLTQITLTTARSLGFGGSGQDLLDPATNLRWGLRYFRRMYDGKDGASGARGDWLNARAAYNAGPDMSPYPADDVARFQRNLTRWQIRYQTSPADSEDSPPDFPAPPAPAEAGFGGLALLVGLGAFLPFLLRKAKGGR